MDGRKFVPIAFVFANDQDARVLLYIPFGLAWMAVSWTMLNGRVSSTDSGTVMAGLR